MDLWDCFHTIRNLGPNRIGVGVLYPNRKMPKKRFLNVEYAEIRTGIEVSKFEDFCEVQDAVKAKYCEDIPGPAPRIQLYDQEDQQITDLDDIPKEYYKKLKDGGLFLVIRTLPPPIREPSRNDLFEAGIDYLIAAGDKERKRRRTEWEISTLAELKYDPKSTLFQLDTNYLANTGLSKEKLVLYCRPTFHEQFKFLRERVIENGVLGWILGPPGTGKSTTALAFASTLERKDWIVTWIHLDRDKFPVCVRLEGASKKSREICNSNIDELFTILEEVNESNKHIVFIDGYTINGRKHSKVQQTCYSWLEKDKEKRRLVVVCSMSSRYKANKETDMLLNLETFHVYSWKEEEYLLAVQNDEFFNNVEGALDADLQVGLPREDLVRSKLYFAGASARWMFLLTTQAVIEQTDESVASVDDIFSYIKGTVGDKSNNVVNRLFSSSFEVYDMFHRKTSIVSRFAGVMLAIKAGPDLIRHLAEATKLDGNPSMDGWMLEMWFFANLRHGEVKLFDNSDEEFQTWPNSIVITLDVTCFPALPANKGVCFKPSKWNQGGFDAVFLEKGKGLVRFVQVTGGDKHSFKIEYFYNFLLRLSESSESFTVECLEIFFVVDQKKRSTFQLAKPSVEGMLRDFGWKFGEELDNVKVVFMKGWCD